MAWEQGYSCCAAAANMRGQPSAEPYNQTRNLVINRKLSACFNSDNGGENMGSTFVLKCARYGCDRRDILICDMMRNFLHHEATSITVK